MPQRLRIALIADIHHGSQHQSKDGAAALGLLEQFLGFVEQTQPNLVVDLGDRINDHSREEDLRREAEVATLLKQLKVPRFHLLGNHDRAFLTSEENSQILEFECVNQSTDLNGWHLVFWQGDTRYKPERPEGIFHFDQGELEWLEADLAQAHSPTILFSHLPTVPSSMAGNWYFEQRFASGTTYSNWSEARRVVRESGKVPLAVAGHVHWNSLQITDGTVYLTQQSLTEQFVSGQTAGAWGLLELQPEQLNYQVWGQEWFKLNLPLHHKETAHAEGLAAAHG